MEQKSNVVSVPPRRVKITHKGLHGWVEYLPTAREWRWSLNTQITLKQNGTAKSKDEAALELKRFLEVAANGKHVRTVD